MEIYVPQPSEPSQSEATGQPGFVRDHRSLVERTCAGDRAAAEILLTTVLGRTIETVSRRWRYPDLLDELFVFLSENDWRRLRSWSGRSSLEGWIRVVAGRLCGERVQDQRRLVPLPLMEDSGFLAGEEPAIERLIKEQTRLGLLDAIERLETARDRFVLRRHFFDGLSLPEIAVELGAPISTIYVVKSRALARLRRELEGGSSRGETSRP